jgi:hypothetical protein
MPRKSRVRLGLQGQKWLNTRLSEDRNTLTATVTALELEASSLPLTTNEDFDMVNEEDTSAVEPLFANAQGPTASSNVTDTDDEFDSEEAAVNASTTVAQQVQMHCGTNNSADSTDDDNNSNDESNVKLSPVDCATLDVLKLCHDAGVSLEFYDILFALLRKHSSKNQVDITKLPKRETFLKSLRARISSPMPIISEVGNLQVPHFNILSQIRDLLGSFVFNDLNNLCVNLDAEQRYRVFVATDDDKFVEMCAQKWYKQTHAEFVTDPQKQFLLPLIFYIDETGTDVFQRYPLEPLMFTLGILRNFIRERSSSWRHAGFIPKVAKAKTSSESLCFQAVLPSFDPIRLIQSDDNAAIKSVFGTSKTSADPPPALPFVSAFSLLSMIECLGHSADNAVGSYGWSRNAPLS